jgi:hypothetical protein
MDAHFRRVKIFAELSDLLRDDAPDVRRLSSLMIDYARTPPAGWVQARVNWVRGRLAEMAAAGKDVPAARLKGILRHLLEAAARGDNAGVADMFRGALACHPADLGLFRLEMANWLEEKVVRGWPPLPEELMAGPPEDAPPAQTDKRRPCYERDHLWLQWHEEEGLGPAAIRDRWNQEFAQHGGAKIGVKRAGFDVVAEGLKKARKEKQQEGG